MLTPPSSSDEGGHPGRAGGASDVVGDRLDQAAKANNSDTVLEPGANINNASDDVQAEEISLLGPIVGAASSPIPSLATQEPVWPPTSGQVTGLEHFFAGVQLGGDRQCFGRSAGCRPRRLRRLRLHRRLPLHRRSIRWTQQPPR